MMRICNVQIKNFRGYQQQVSIPIENLTVFVGKNDVGKSSILEALDIFFNDGKGVIKIDKTDVNRFAEKQGNTETVISVCFNALPEKVVLDATNETNLKNEFLLNSEDCLEIVKKHTNGGACRIFIRANHPTNPKCSDLLTMKDMELRKTIEINHIPCNDKSRNASMRNAIWSHYKEDLQIETIDIDVTKGDTKSIWEKLQKYLPVYSLFQADRKNTDGDSEIQDPLKEAVKQILGEPEIRDTLDRVAEVVETKLKIVSNRTLEKLKEMNPDVASSLEPVIPSPANLKWTDVFKGVSISSEDNIPLNKRGSGVKRLVLLNFFRAEAERRIEENQNTNIIYAIEEPETSQHSENQIKLIQAFRELSNNPNTQVIMSTHSGTIVKGLRFDNLRLIRNDDGIKTVDRVDPCQLPYPSLTEVNFLAFSEITEEYHDELYGYIECNKWLDEFNLKKPTKDYIEERKGVLSKPREIPLSTYIRHQIHHPENTNNTKYTQVELRESIMYMRDFIRSKRALGLF